MIQVKGSSKQLDAILKKLGKLSGNTVREQMSKALSASAVSQVALGFRQGRNPYGEPWAPLKLRQGQPLRDRRILQNSFTAEAVEPAGFRIGTNVKYASVHQTGAVIVPKNNRFLRFRAPGAARGGTGPFIFAKKVTIPQRLMVPIKSRGLGALWSKAFLATAKRVFARFATQEQ